MNEMHESMSGRATKFTSLFGGEFYLAQNDLRKYFSEPCVMSFLAMCAIVVVVYRSGEHYTVVETLVTPNLVFVLEFLNALAVLTLLNVLFYLQAFLQQRGLIRSVLIPLATLPTACFIQISTATTVWGLTSSWPEQIVSPVELSQDVVVILMFEAMFALYVVPVSKTFTRNAPGKFMKQPDAENHALTSEATRAKLAEPVRAPDIHVSSTDMALRLSEADRRLASQINEAGSEDGEDGKAKEALPVFVNSIRNMTPQDFEYVRSQGHYLNFVKGKQQTRIRGNLCSVHDQFGTDHGIQVNRSAWVSFAAVRQIREEDGRCIIEHVSGHEEKITSARKLAVVMAYEAYQSLLDNVSCKASTLGEHQAEIRPSRA